MDDLQSLLAELTSGEDERAEAAIHGLAAHGEAAVTALQPYLSHTDADYRWWAVRALAEIPHEKVPRLLLGTLEDEEISVRQCAALALRHQPTEQAVPALVEALHSPNQLLANLAADALIAIGPAAVPALIEVMKNAPQAARLNAVRALAMIGDHRSIPVLFEALSEDSVVIEHWANEGLERMGVGMAFFKP